MSETTQHTIVFGIVALCVLFVAWQAFGSLIMGRRTSMGKCCQKGCDPQTKAGVQTGVHFLPVDMLSRKKRGA